MRVINLNKEFTLEKQSQNIPLIIGNFDGIHKGHKILFDKVKNQKFNVLTFENIPHKQSKKLYSFAEKIKQLSSFTPVSIFVMDLKKVNCTADEFKRWYLSKINPSQIIIGTDFKFGTDFLTYQALQPNFDVSAIKYDSNYSSTKIREWLLKGQVEEANTILIENYYRVGKVKQGQQIATALGYPTANIYFDDSYAQLKSGTYASLVECDGVVHRSVTFVGKSKTLKNESLPAFETHILDNFYKKLYDHEIKINFIKFIRPNEKFNNKEDLINAIKSDLEIIKKI